jgi:hypothetical protein
MYGVGHPPRSFWTCDHPVRLNTTVARLRNPRRICGAPAPFAIQPSARAVISMYRHSPTLAWPVKCQRQNEVVLLKGSVNFVPSVSQRGAILGAAAVAMRYRSSSRQAYALPLSLVVRRQQDLGRKSPDRKA